MYQHSNHSYSSYDSLRRSSNNPFRQQQSTFSHENDFFSGPKSSTSTSTSTSSSNYYDQWIQKNKGLMYTSDDDCLEKPKASPNKLFSYYQHQNTSVDSLRDERRNKSNLIYEYGNGSKSEHGSKSASGLGKSRMPKAIRADSDSSVDYSKRQMKSNNPFASAMNEDRYSPPERPQGRSSTPPARPPKPPQDELAPPSYEEAAGSEAAKREYPREKEPSSLRHQNNHRSSNNGSGHSSSSSSRNPHRHTSSSRRPYKSSSSKNKSPNKKKEAVPAKNLDTIDKLDVTGFFGGGFHHDGPFDACTPHRNKNVKKAPVMAFPVDGPNNSIAGARTVDKDAQMKLAFGYDEQNDIKEAPPVIKTNRVSNDPSTSIYTPKQNPSVINFDSQAKAEPIHGLSTAGLGSTTFLDGAPAPKNVEEHLNTNNGGLGRKKSLVQRLRKNSGSEQDSRRNSNDGLYTAVSDNVSGRRGSLNAIEVDGTDGWLKPPGNSFIRRVKSLKVKK
ncbi:hypothetical protein KGF56_002131 [Candida oxycetoniae]|uniref:Uncharacterized protein n=1 Tax=Candida oxycetoniae TaxID=497107 RepID=A0AAI9WY64_9ASCO|nr:uncharacterized protein KGF56_002131 [Candida oxycetoniae]KAI3405046.2 hypothetical protein KGF56_002131 [Candida oxycetoniae]